MFWLWFIITGIAGSLFLGRKIRRWRKSIPDDGLKGLTLVGLFFFVVMGIFGLVNQTDSVFWLLLTSVLSWTGIISASEQLTRLANPKPETAIEQKRVPPTVSSKHTTVKYLTPDSNKPRQVWPPAPQQKEYSDSYQGFAEIFKPSLTDREVDQIAAEQFIPSPTPEESVSRAKPASNASSLPLLRKARSLLIRVLKQRPEKFAKVRTQPTEPTAVELPGKSFLTPIESKFSTPDPSAISNPLSLTEPIRSQDLSAEEKLTLTKSSITSPN